MFKGTKSLLTNLILMGVFLFGIYPLIPHRYESLSVILLLLSAIISFIVKGNKNRYTNTFFMTSSIYFLLFASVLFSANKVEGFNKMETMLSLLIIPLVFYILLGRLSIDFIKVRSFFFKTYYFSSLVFSSFSFYLFSIYKNPKYLTADSNFYRSAILENTYIGDHPIYVSIFLSIAIIFGFSFFYKERKLTWIFFLLIMAQVYLITLLFMLMSKGVILALTTVIIIHLFRQKRFNKVYTLCIIIVCSSFFFLIPKKNNRFEELISLNSYGELDENNSTSIRVLIYKCGTEALLENPILGNGIGDVQDLLEMCYSNEKANFTKGMYNSHNQYLFIWLSSGMVGFLIFLGLIIFYFKKAIQYNDNSMFSILVLYCMIFLFENVLSRQSGVIFFSFIVNYFLWDNLNRNKISVKPSDLNL